ncbi:MAG TPA: GTPase ObgE [Spirochaetota bacterium]|nr:GTPase ObgE [Spirochaetota bacterium]HOM39111.1 GTPase ObgE [Spirochaetota bacterium]HPQ49994.1 GTPase ObgE [Spirochaetota bacterium]
MIDEARITVVAGNGGNGCVSFRREKYIPRGGPDGGDGGEGGSVYIESDSRIKTLSRLNGRTFRASKGEHGKGNNRHGKNGESIVIKVPVGTIIRDEDTGQIIADLKKDCEKVLVARGGKGGKGNASFKTSTNRAPRYAQKGKDGQIRHIKLELKIIADVGIVGFPNAGKSTLISSISNSRPKIAPYPFTTITPNLGIVDIDEINHFVIVDIPGIIEGASKGKGLGLRFLKHIERTKILLFLLDINDEPLKKFKILRRELKNYNEKLIKKKYILCLNKIDSLPEEEVNSTKETFIRKGIKEEKIFTISALKKLGLDNVKYKLFEILKDVENRNK